MVKKPRAKKTAIPKPQKRKDKPFDPPDDPPKTVVNPAPLIERPPYGGGDDDR